jgi:hypothetical protein
VACAGSWAAYDEDVDPASGDLKDGSGGVGVSVRSGILRSFSRNVDDMERSKRGSGNVRAVFLTYETNFLTYQSGPTVFLPTTVF